MRAFIISAFLLVTTAVNAFADDGDGGNNSFFSLPVVAAIICYFRRKEPMGGWLLFYMFTVCYGAFSSIPNIIIQGVGGGWLPSNYDNKIDFYFNMFTSVPTNLCIVLEIVLCILLMAQGTRNIKYVSILKNVLFTDVIISAVSLPLQIISENYIGAVISFAHVLLSSIWFFYFKKSGRVKMVFEDNNWDYNEFILIKKTNVKVNIEVSPE